MVDAEPPPAEVQAQPPPQHEQPRRPQLEPPLSPEFEECALTPNAIEARAWCCFEQECARGRC
jgi:hypothetical protein